MDNAGSGNSHSICERMVEMLQDCLDRRRNLLPSTVEQLKQTIDMLRITDAMVLCAEGLVLNEQTEEQYRQAWDDALEAVQDSFISGRYGGK